MSKAVWSVPVEYSTGKTSSDQGMYFISIGHARQLHLKRDWL
jgi:hypothetical protein